VNLQLASINNPVKGIAVVVGSSGALKACWQEEGSGWFLREQVKGIIIIIIIIIIKQHP
jgi:hypothetical protein